MESEPPDERNIRLKIDRYALPISYEFDAARLGDAPLYGELSLGYVHAKSHYDDVLSGTPYESDVHSKIKSFSGLGGVGFAIPLGDGWKFTPIGMLGMSRVDDESTFDGVGAGNMKALSDNMFFNYRGRDWLYGAAVKLDYGRKLDGDIDLTGTLRYNQIFTHVLTSDNRVLNDNGNFGVLTGRVEFNGPTCWEVWGKKLRWIGFGAGTGLFQDASQGAGFRYFGEIGGGLEWVDAVPIPGVKGVALRGSFIYGDKSMTGWSAGLEFKF